MGSPVSGRATAVTLGIGLFAAAVALAQSRPAPSPNASPWDAPPEARQLVNPVKLDGQTVERGQRLYRQHCLPCHGSTGVGDGPLAKKMGYTPANLTLERLNRQTDGEIFWKVSKGRSPMPQFEKDLRERERWDVVSYVRTLLRVMPSDIH